MCRTFRSYRLCRLMCGRALPFRTISEKSRGYAPESLGHSPEEFSASAEGLSPSAHQAAKPQKNHCLVICDRPNSHQALA